MKLIGQTHNGFLAELSNRELALILGFRSSTEEGFKKSRLEIGSEVKIDKPYESAEYMRGLKSGKLRMLRSSLSHAIDSVDEAAGIVDELNLFESLKED